MRWPLSRLQFIVFLLAYLVVASHLICIATGCKKKFRDNKSLKAHQRQCKLWHRSLENATVQLRANLVQSETVKTQRLATAQDSTAKRQAIRESLDMVCAQLAL